MIVRADDNSLYLIAQPDHAALSRRIMERWTPLHDVERRASILLAIEQHDNGWQELDTQPTVDPATGSVHDFVHIPADVRQAVWPRGVSRLAGDDAWAAALVAHHAVTIYDRYRSDTAWAGFFPRLERLRDELADSCRRTQAQLAHDYAFVRIGDLVSLMFCTHWDEPQTFEQWTFQRHGDRVTAARHTPDPAADPGGDPFGGREVPIAVNARRIPQRRYQSDEDLRQTLRQSPVVSLRGVVTGDLSVSV